MVKNPIRPIRIGSRLIGPGHPCFIIAEAGVNHNGSLDLALKLVDAAAEAGADAVKFQTFKAERVVGPDAPQAAYQRAGGGTAQSQLEMVRKLELSHDAFVRIETHCRQRGILFLSTPFDEESADFLDRMGMAAFKVGSGDLTHHAHLRHLAAKGRPVLLSTGMADWTEVEEAMEVLHRAGADAIALFHCVSSYPAPPGDCHLRVVGALAERFGVPAGWSDHTEGIHIALAAAALGAHLIEKHFTLDRTLPGPDHAASIEPGTLRALVAQVRAVEEAVGEADKRLRPSEADVSRVARRSLHTARRLPQGHVLTGGDIVLMRPGTGMPPNRLGSVLGRPLARDLDAGAMLTEEDLA